MSSLTLNSIVQKDTLVEIVKHWTPFYRILNKLEHIHMLVNGNGTWTSYFLLWSYKHQMSNVVCPITELQPLKKLARHIAFQYIKPIERIWLDKASTWFSTLKNLIKTKSVKCLQHFSHDCKRTPIALHFMIRPIISYLETDA